MIYAIAAKDLKSLFTSPVAWVVLTFVQLVLGYGFLKRFDDFMQVQPQLMQLPSPPGFTEMVAAPTFASTAAILLFAVPLLAMRLIAEERPDAAILDPYPRVLAPGLAIDPDVGLLAGQHLSLNGVDTHRLPYALGGRFGVAGDHEIGHADLWITAFVGERHDEFGLLLWFLGILQRRGRHECRDRRRGGWWCPAATDPGRRELCRGRYRTDR